MGVLPCGLLEKPTGEPKVEYANKMDVSHKIIEFSHSLIPVE